MRRDWGRRVFVALLALCLGGLAFAFARQSVVDRLDFEQRYPRINDTVTMTAETDGTLRFEGEGKLYREDVNALVREAGLRVPRVTDIIVGDGITEIGYRAFLGFAKLRTLKLGDGVVRVAVSGVGNCPALRYLRLPKGLESVGLDFLQRCNGCQVVTDGQTLPEMANVLPDQVLWGVDSYGALVEAADDPDLPRAVAAWFPEDQA